MSTSFVMVESVVLMTCKKWHHIGSHTLIYVESAHNPITFSLADALEDDKPTFEA
jgi:hypothetical protein